MLNLRRSHPRLLLWALCSSVTPSRDGLFSSSLHLTSAFASDCEDMWSLLAVKASFFLKFWVMLRGRSASCRILQVSLGCRGCFQATQFASRSRLQRLFPSRVQNKK